jgi:hypothetical protein
MCAQVNVYMSYIIHIVDARYMELLHLCDWLGTCIRDYLSTRNLSQVVVVSELIASVVIQYIV